jgi:hypothetical protein
MSEFSKDVRERKLSKPGPNLKIHRRVITIEEVSGSEPFNYQVKITDIEISEQNFIPTHRTIVPRKTIEEAIEDAEEEFLTSVEKGNFTSLPVGEHFPLF